jgi:phage gpG-like protein
MIMPQLNLSTDWVQFDPIRWPELMKAVSDILEETVVANFSQGGRPSRWPDKVTPYGNYVPSFRGSSRSRVVKSSGKDWARASLTDSRLYDFANEFGAKPRPHVTERSQKFFWHMYFETGNEMWKYMAMMKVGRTLRPTLPSRKAFVFQKEDIERINEMLKGFIHEAITPKAKRRTG